MPGPRRTNRFDTATPRNPDPLDYNVGEAGTWGLPSDEGISGQLHGESPSMLRQPPPTPNTYPEGIVVGHDFEENAQPVFPPAHLIGAQVDAPRSFQLPHEATHRRYEPTLRVLVNQAAAGFTLIAAPNIGLHYVKLIACNLTLDAAGTIKFVQGDAAGTGVVAAQGPGDITGAMNMGGGSAPPLCLPPAEIANPWFYTSPDLALGIFTVTGKAQGWVTFCYSPYDS